MRFGVRPFAPPQSDNFVATTRFATDRLVADARLVSGHADRSYGARNFASTQRPCHWELGRPSEALACLSCKTHGIYAFLDESPSSFVRLRRLKAGPAGTLLSILSWNEQGARPVVAQASLWCDTKQTRWRCTGFMRFCTRVSHRQRVVGSRS